MGQPVFFVNRASGVIAQITEVNESYARIAMVHPHPGGYSMPRAEYDAHFAERWRPARPEDLSRLDPGGYEPPANAPADWH